MASSGSLASTFDVVRRTRNAHASAINALERATHAEMVRNRRRSIGEAFLCMKNLSQALLATNRQALQDDHAAMIRQVDEKLARGEARLEEKLARGEASLDEKRAAVERDRAEVDEEKARMRAAAPPPDCVFKLNVGGVRFETSRAVLTKVEDSMLGRMFGRCDAMLQCDSLDGSIFIDRDGERFRTILDFLRDVDAPLTRNGIRGLSEAAQEAMVKELDYFGLEAAVFGAPPWIDSAVFRPGPDMGSARVACASASAGGRVFVVGGCADGCVLKSTLLLDSQTMVFRAGPDLLSPRYNCAAVQLDVDSVLVVGGIDGPFLKTTEILHLSTLSVTPGPNMLSVRCWCAAVKLDARRILVGGGYDGASDLTTTEIFSLDTMAFTLGPIMIHPRHGCAAVALDEHRFLVAGGESDSGHLQTTEILDLRTMAFAPGPPMGSVRYLCAAVSVDAEHVLIIGGDDSSSTALATTEVLDVAKMEFAPGPNMRTARYSCAAARLEGDEARIFVCGGHGISTTETLTV